MSLPLPFPASTITLDYGDTDRPYSAWSPHQGTDFSSRSQGVVAGATIRASATGVVHRAGWETGEQSPTMDRPNKNAGNSIDVDYPSAGVRVRYMHRPTSSPSPAAGDRVTEGASLGVVGDTGYVTAAHLHMETWDLATGRRVNPANYFDFTRVVDSSATAGRSASPFDPEEDDMTVQQYEDLMWEIACTRPIKLYALVNDKGEGGWIWMGPSGRWWVVPSGEYAALVAAEKLSQPRPVRAIQQNELDFISNQLLGGLVPDPKNDYNAETQLEHILTLDDATVKKLAASIAEVPVTVSGTQLQQIADAAAKGAEEGGAEGAKAAISGLSFVVTAA